jgi:hypothetical protein
VVENWRFSTDPEVGAPQTTKVATQIVGQFHCRGLETPSTGPLQVRLWPMLLKKSASDRSGRLAHLEARRRCGAGRCRLYLQPCRARSGWHPA